MLRGLLEECLETGICPSCRERKSSIDRQYSYGVYAGVMCTDCAIAKYRDGCGHVAGHFPISDLEETYWED